MFQVSMVVPVYQAEAYLDEAVRSILALPEVAELLLVDDGSRDSSLEICRTWAARDPRVRVLQHPDGLNRGVSATRNLGILSAKHDFVAFLDADDICLPDRFHTDAKVLLSEPGADGSYNAIGVLVQDPKGKALFEQRFDQGLTTIRKVIPPHLLFHALSGGILDVGHFSLDGLTIRRAALLRMPLLLREDMAMHEDSEFIIRLSYHCTLLPSSIEEPVALRRVHAENRITRNDQLARTRSKQFQHLLAWSTSVKAPIDAQQRFAAEAAHYRIRVLAAERAPWRALGLLLSAPGQFKRPDSLHAVIDGFFGTWRIGRALHSGVEHLFACLWRLKGKPRPAVKAENRYV